MSGSTLDGASASLPGTPAASFEVRLGPRILALLFVLLALTALPWGVTKAREKAWLRANALFAPGSTCTVLARLGNDTSELGEPDHAATVFWTGLVVGLGLCLAPGIVALWRG